MKYSKRCVLQLPCLLEFEKPNESHCLLSLCKFGTNLEIKCQHQKDGSESINFITVRAEFGLYKALSKLNFTLKLKAFSLHWQGLPWQTFCIDEQKFCSF